MANARQAPLYDAPSSYTDSSTALVILSLTVFAVIAAVFFKKMDELIAAISNLAASVTDAAEILRDAIEGATSTIAQCIALNAHVTASAIQEVNALAKASVELTQIAGHGRGNSGGYGQGRVGTPRAMGLITAGGETITGKKIGMAASAVTIATGVAALGGSCNVM